MAAKNGPKKGADAPIAEITERPGFFYLGKGESGKSEAFFYDSKDLTTHAVCVGMTGSGKTGLGIALLEEAALNGIPALIIDPKGDLTDLLLLFPELSPQEFAPWVETEDQAEPTAKRWKEGLEKWGEGKERIRKLEKAVERVIYTPASTAGIPLSILSSFAAPSKEILQDSGAFRDKVLSTTSSLLGLLGINADPLKSREHILISTLIDQAWQKGKDLDIATLIGSVQNPPFDKIGALDIDTFFPLKERLALSINLNNLLASPGFHAWMEGEALDIEKLLTAKDGKPKHSILFIAHLSDAERMFFVTLLLNEFLSWMRRQKGSSNLKAILYMDEIFGYFPPTAVPPSKIPMLTLLKQARAFGVGIVLATQNPVDLDYKGLANCGTWFIGKLQTDRDRSKVVEGLKNGTTGEVGGDLEKLLASTGSRIFLMRNVHEKEPVLFETRWTLSYLRGPLTLTEIASLTTDRPKTVSIEKSKSSAKPIVPMGIEEFYLPSEGDSPVQYHPQFLGIGKVHFVDAKSKIDTWQDLCVLGEIGEWDKGEREPLVKDRLDKTPAPHCTYEGLPSGINAEQWKKDFLNALYQTETFPIFELPLLKQISKVGESEEDFKARVREELLQKIRGKYQEKTDVLSDKLKRLEAKSTEKSQKSLWDKANTAISFGATILGAIIGKKVTKGTINQASSSLKKVGTWGQGSQAATQAEDELKTCQQQLQDVQNEMNQEMEGANSLKVETLNLRPRKNDITVEKVVLVWVPKKTTTSSP